MKCQKISSSSIFHQFQNFLCSIHAKGPPSSLTFLMKGNYYLTVTLTSIHINILTMAVYGFHFALLEAVWHWSTALHAFTHPKLGESIWEFDSTNLVFI